MVVKTPGGEQAVTLRVADTVYDPSLAPAPQHQQGNGYLSTASLATSGRQAVLDQLKIQVADPGQATPSRDRDAIVAVAGDVGAWLQREYGLAIREIQVPEPYAHPHQWQADALLLSLLAGGAAALALSTILVANMLNGLFTQQIPQIGIMKAIGARSGITPSPASKPVTPYNCSSVGAPPPGASSASSKKGKAVVAACTPRPRVSPTPWGSHSG